MELDLTPSDEWVKQIVRQAGERRLIQLMESNDVHEKVRDAAKNEYNRRYFEVDDSPYVMNWKPKRVS